MYKLHNRRIAFVDNAFSNILDPKPYFAGNVLCQRSVFDFGVRKVKAVSRCSKPDGLRKGCPVQNLRNCTGITMY